jgi:predicted ABC-type ATPase
MYNKNHEKFYIIAGPNGSGKTTFAITFLPEYAKCDRFINADLVARKQNAHIDVVDQNLFAKITKKVAAK